MGKVGFVYFITNKYNKVLYLGVTNNLRRRVAEHILKINMGFTSKYNCDKLVYYEVFDYIGDAIAREKQLKNWRRSWKNELINKKNPNWLDLREEIELSLEFIQEVKKWHEMLRIK